MIGLFNTIGKEEEEAVKRVIKRGVLSGYVAGNELGGIEIEALRHEWAKYFGIQTHRVIPCNSATSGLWAACLAADAFMSREVIVPYITMSATAAAPAMLGATVIFADVDDHFCIDPGDVGRHLNENTAAVIAVNLFGHPAKLHQLRSMCDAVGALLIEDNSQAILASENLAPTGLIGHIGVFSLNVHKHIQTGEGGIIVCENAQLAVKLQAAINHGENRGPYIGLNLRMTELTAAVAREQLKKLPAIVERRHYIGKRIQSIFADWAPVDAILDRPGCYNSFYAVPFICNDETSFRIAKTMRSRFVPIPMSVGYTNLLGINWPKNVITNVEYLMEQPSLDRLDRLGLVEVCQYDIQDQHLDKMAELLHER